MSVFECLKLAQEYANWLKEDIKAVNAGDVCILTVPFLDRHRDYLQIYVRPAENGLILSDDGYVLRDLSISGLTLDTERRQEALHQILRSFGVTLNGDELQLVATNGDFPQKKHNLVQAMLAVGDLIYLAQETVATLFKEDVEKYLRSRRIPIGVDVKLTGSSGFNHSFDFLIGSIGEQPERYIKAIGTPSRENVVDLMFSWQDLHDVRPRNARAYAFLNDQERRINETLVVALSKYNIEAIRWSERESKVALLERSSNSHT